MTWMPEEVAGKKKKRNENAGYLMRAHGARSDIGFAENKHTVHIVWQDRKTWLC